MIVQTGGRQTFKWAFMVSSACVLTWGAAANAQTMSDTEVAEAAAAPEMGAGDIVVTAQRREQRLDKVGLSISAYSSEQINTLGLNTATELAQHTPGISLETTGGTGTTALLTVRGVAATDFSANQESPNALYIDDVYISAPAATSFPLFDLERVEVLRGPQGTLFGRNATGGLVNFITAKPKDSSSGYAEATYGSFNEFRVEAAVGGRLDEHSNFRLAGLYARNDGFWKNVGAPNGLQEKFIGVRAQIETELSSRLKTHATFTYSGSPKARGSAAYDIEPSYVDPATGRPASLPVDLDAYGTGPGNDALGYRDPYGSAWKSAYNNIGFSTKRHLSPTFRLDWEVNDAISLTSLTNYQRLDWDYQEDCDSEPLDACRFTSDQDLDQWSEELRLSKLGDRLNWTAGVYYLEVTQHIFQTYAFPAFADTPFAFDARNGLDQSVKSFSIFGQFDYLLTADLKVTLGARAVYDKKTFSSQAALNGNAVYDFSSATVGDAARQSRWDWAGRAQIDYTVSDDSLLYASISRGVKAAGFNTNLAAVASPTFDEVTPFRSEVMTAYEIGAKNKLFDRRLRLNLSAFYYDYGHFQAYQFQGITSLVTNNDARMYGGEAEITLNPVRSLDILAGVAYLKTKVYDVATTYSGVRDQQAVNAPRWSVNGSIRKTFDIGEGELALIYDLNYVSSRFASVDNNFATNMAASTIHNARIGYNYKPIGMEISAFVKNFKNDDRAISSNDYTLAFGTKARVLAPPRRFGVEIRKTF